MEGVALRELIDEQKEAMRLDVRGEETFEFVVVVLDAFREELSSPLSHLSLCFSVVQSGASYLSQDFVMFFHVSCEGLPGQ